MTKAVGYAAQSAETALGQFNFERRELRDDNVRIAIRCCARASPPIRRCAIGRSDRATR
jgi:hypothetical protein